MTDVPIPQGERKREAADRNRTLNSDEYTVLRYILKISKGKNKISTHFIFEKYTVGGMFPFLNNLLCSKIVCLPLFPFPFSLIILLQSPHPYTLYKVYAQPQGQAQRPSGQAGAF